MVPNDYAMCAEHWAQVPRDLQIAIYDAWNGVAPDPTFRDLVRQAAAAIDWKKQGDLFAEVAR